MKVEKGDILEIAGIAVGKVEEVSENTLLVRRGEIAYLNEQATLVLAPQAVYVNRQIIEDSYWIKSLKSAIITESVNFQDGLSLIREFKYV